MQLFGLEPVISYKEKIARALTIDAIYYLYIWCRHQARKPAWATMVQIFKLRLSDVLAKKPRLMATLPQLERLPNSLPDYTPTPSTPEHAPTSRDGPRVETQHNNTPPTPTTHPTEHPPPMTTPSNNDLANATAGTERELQREGPLSRA